MSFSIQRLVNGRVLVKGEDVNGVTNQTTLDSTQWDEVNADKNYSQARDAFDSAVNRFFAPLIEAAEKTDTALAPKAKDPVSYVVLSEAVEGVEAKATHLVRLNNDSIVLRLIEQGDTNRLVWVDDSLEVLEATPAAPVAGYSDGPDPV